MDPPITTHLDEAEQIVSIDIRIPCRMPNTPEVREEFKEHVRKLLHAANDINRAHGGPGLAVVDASLIVSHTTYRSPWWRRFWKRGE